MIGFLLASVQMYFDWENIRPSKERTDGCAPWNPPRATQHFEPGDPSGDVALSVSLDVDEWWATQDPCATPPIVVWWRVIGALFAIVIATLFGRMIYNSAPKPVNRWVLFK